MTKFQNLRQRADKRLIALVAILAIGIGAAQSMAALTSTLTTTSTFQVAVAKLTGNATATAVTIYDNQPLGVGGLYFRSLIIKNEGNLALAVTSGTHAIAGTPTPGDLGTLIESKRVFATAQDTNLPCNATAFSGTDMSDAGPGWTKPTTAAMAWSGNYSTNFINTSVFPVNLNPGKSQQVCIVVRIPTAPTNPAATATWTIPLTGTES